MKKSTIVQRHKPCPCGRSSDAYCIYSDGHGHCFSCGETHGAKHIHTEEILTEGFTYEHLPFRGVTKETMEKYGVLTKIDSTGTPVSLMYPYSDSSGKVRTIGTKSFLVVGSGFSDTGLFGQRLFSAGSARAITIFEGEQDALSGFQMLGSKYPCVSVKGASSARKDCIGQREYINSFERIYICFDNDAPGREATAKVAALFDFNKVYIFPASDGIKDASDYLQANREKEFVGSWWAAKRYLPDNIVSSFSQFDELLNAQKAVSIGTYPFKTMQKNTYGLRPGEVVLLSAQEGLGKTEVVRAIETHLLRTTDDNIGVIHLEESIDRILKGFAGHELKQPVHLPDTNASTADVSTALRSLVKTDDRLHVFSHFGSEDTDVILDSIRFLVSSCNCKYIFLDHITMIVTGREENDERRTLDILSTKLKMLAKELNFCLILVSHLNDDGQTRGSRNISKVADLHVQLHRDITAETEVERNTTTLMCVKNRFGSITGPFGKLYFDRETFLLKEIDDNFSPEPPLKASE